MFAPLCVNPHTRLKPERGALMAPFTIRRLIGPERLDSIMTSAAAQAAGPRKVHGRLRVGHLPAPGRACHNSMTAIAT